MGYSQTKGALVVTPPAPGHCLITCCLDSSGSCAFVFFPLQIPFYPVVVTDGKRPPRDGILRWIRG